MNLLFSIRTTGLLFAVLAAAAVFAPIASASPVGESYDFGFRGFAFIDGAWVMQDGEPGEDGGQYGPFVFGTPGALTLFGNPLTLNSSVVTTGPNEETWTFSLVADDGGPLFDPQAGFEGVAFFAFRTIGIGAIGADATGTESDPIFSPSQDTDLGVWNDNPTAIEIIDGSDAVVTTRNLFDNTSALGTRLHVSFTNAADSEIIISGGGDVPADTSEIRISYVTSVVPEPSSLALLALGGVAMLRRHR